LKGDKTMRLMICTVVAIAVVFGASAYAAEAPVACTNPNAPLPASLAGWGKPAIPMETAHTVAEAGARSLPLGQRIAFKLANTTTVQFAHQPTEQMPKQYVYSGMASFHVPKDGTYSVMIGEANWIDVVQNGQPVRSLEMRRGRIPCITYGKKIEFPLKSGEAIVQFFGAPYETVDVLIAPAP
jgi:hypothetical protein